jgi:GGDEF domain-containing protein
MINLLPKDEFASRFREMTERRPHARRRQCVLVIGVDDLGAIKGSRGARAVEEAIAKVARVLLRSPSGTAMPLLHPSDIVGCHGEGQLAVLLAPDVDLESATVVAEQILEGVHGANGEGEAALPGLSIGVAALPMHASTAHGVLLAAERAANRAHSGGGRRVQLAEPAGF